MRKFGLVLILFSFLAGAQSVELDSLSADSVEKPLPAYYLGFYVDVGLLSAPTIPKRNIEREWVIGAQYNRWMIEGVLVDQLGGFDNVVVFPNIFSFRYRHAGIRLAYNFLQGKVVTLRGGVGIFAGDMLWEYKDTEVEFQRETFSAAKLHAALEYDKFRFVKPYVRLGYQRVFDVELLAASGSDFEGWNAKIGIRVGFFNQ